MGSGDQVIRVLIADDHPIFRDGLRRLLESEPGFQVVGEAQDGAEAVKLARAVKPDILLLDMAMPKVTGLLALQEMADAGDMVRTILLTASIGEEDMVTALQLGARGVVMKDAATQILFKSIRSVMDGQYWVGRAGVTNLVQTLRKMMAANTEQANKKTFGLTKRELEVIGAIVAGYSNKDIAREFKISEDTVKHHLTNIFDKVGVSSRLELALFAVNHKLVVETLITRMHLRHVRRVALLVMLTAAGAPSVHAQTQNAGVCPCQIPNGPPNPHPYLVGYLGVYKNADWSAIAKTLDFDKMTHLNLAFINPPTCAGSCTAKSDMTLAGNRSLTDDALKAIVDAAHAHGTKVLISIGGAGGDKNIMQFYNAGLSAELTDVIDAYLTTHDIDGVDVDVEQPKQMGVPYTTFVNTLVAKLRPHGKLITTAVAQYIQAGAQDEVLPLFDIVNVMIYGDYQRSVTDMAYWANTKHVPKEKLTLGIGFHNYSTILANYPNAWAVDSVGGGTYRDGAVITYQGENTVARETQLGAQYGGAMIWELTQDDPTSPHSLLKVIQKNLDPAAPRIH